MRVKSDVPKYSVLLHHLHCYSFQKRIALAKKNILPVQNICGHKSEIMWCMGLKNCMGDEHHRYYNHTKFHQNPRGDRPYNFLLI